MADKRTNNSEQSKSMPVIELEALQNSWNGNTRNTAFASVVKIHDIKLKSSEFDGFNWLRVMEGDWTRIEADFDNPSYIDHKRIKLLAWMLEPKN